MDVRSQFRLPEELYAWLKERAAKEHRSINGQLLAELSARRSEQQVGSNSAIHAG